jgi:tRNA-dependent cyclodipeptide synthase
MIHIDAAFGKGSHADRGSRAFIGVSICSRLFGRRNSVEIATWCLDQFDEVLFLVFDEPQAYTFRATRGMQWDVAMERAAKLGDERTDSLRRWFSQLSQSRIEVWRWGQLEADPNYRSVRDGVLTCFASDPDFKADVLEQVQARSGIAQSDLPGFEDWRYEVASRYVLEELAVMVYLQEKSIEPWPIQIFPLAMPKALLGLYQGKYCPDISLDASQSGYIRISVERESTTSSCM